MVDPTMRGQRYIDRFREQMPLAKPVDDLISRTLLGADPALSAALAANKEARLVPHDVAPNQGKLLELLVRGAGATRVLEIAGPTGRVITIEQDPRHAAVALANLRRAGVADRVDVRVGAALSVLPDILSGSDQEFDFVFIDADKENDVSYMQWAIRLSRPGAMILVDNVVRFGGVLDPDAAPDDPGARGSRDLLEFLSTAPGVDCTAIQTVGEKGWDGFLLAVVAP